LVLLQEDLLWSLSTSDRRRLNKAALKSFDVAKTRRKVLRAQRKGFEDKLLKQRVACVKREVTEHMQ